MCSVPVTKLAIEICFATVFSIAIHVCRCMLTNLFT